MVKIRNLVCKNRFNVVKQGFRNPKSCHEDKEGVTKTSREGKDHHDFKLGHCRHHGLRASVRNKTSTQETWRKKGVVTNDGQYEDASMRPCDMRRRF